MVNQQLTQLMTTFREHPYFAWVDKTGELANNHGFYFPKDYPLQKNKEYQYFIDVFGGSVAELFAIFGADSLIKNLEQHSSFQDKEIVVLNFGLISYKQPQQLLILNYYLASGQELDMVINIDGFNEVTFSNINNERGVDISMPSINSMAPIIDLIDQTTLTKEKINLLANMSQFKDQKNSLETQMNNSTFASTYFALAQLHSITINNLDHERLTLANIKSSTLDDSMIHIYLPKTPITEDTVLFERIAQQWANASIMMNTVLKDKDIPYFHFLQPNQYYTNKVFSAEEAHIALYENSPLRAGPENGYSFLIKKSKSLEQNEVKFFNAIDIFDDEPNPVYKDNCCHYNNNGNRVLADFIATSILEVEDF